MSAVPTVYATLAQLPVDADISTLRMPIVGASPLPASVREDFAAHSGRRLLEGYGLTEATCATTWTRPGEERPGSVGRALPGQQIKAVTIGADGSWTDCAPGQAGVLVIGGPVPVAYVVPAGPGPFDEAGLLAWASTAIGEPAARPKRIYPVDAIPVTAVGKHFKPALAADAAVRVVTEALAATGLPDARTSAAHQDGRLIVTVTGADPGRVRDAVAGFALTIRTGPPPAQAAAT